MNKGLNIFLVILLCVVLYIGLLMSFYSSNNSDSWNPQQGYTMPMGGKSSTSAVSVGVGSTSTGVSIPMRSVSRSMRSSRAVSLYAPAQHSSVANTQYPIGGAPSNSVASPMYTTSSATMKSFGGGTNGAVSMSSGVVSTNSQSPISNSQLSILTLPTPMFTSQQMLADAPMMATYEDMSAPRGIAGRRAAPSIGGGGVDNAYVNILTVICGGTPDYSLTDELLYAKWIVYYLSPGAAPVGWNEFLAWYQSVRTLPETPIGEVWALLLMALIFFIGKVCKTLVIANKNLENKKN